MKQAILAYVNHARICSWSQPVLGNKGKVSCLSKQQGTLMELELMTDRYPLHHIALYGYACLLFGIESCFNKSVV